MKRGDTPSSRRKAAAIYLKAAKLVEEAALDPDGGIVGWSCAAIAQAVGKFHQWNYQNAQINAVTNYREIFSGNFGMDDEGECRDHRVVALCLMAAMVEAGDA